MHKWARTMKAIGSGYFNQTRKLYGDNTKTLKQRINPQTFYESEQDQVKRANGKGWAEAGLCPFHDDNKAGNFYVNLNSGGFHCFSCASKGGDVIAYTVQRYGLGFVDAMKRLEKDWT